MNRFSNRNRDLVQLLKLHQVRVSSAEARYRAEQVERDKAAADAKKRQARIAVLQSQRMSLSSHYLQTKENATELARFATFAIARKEWLDDSLERDEYWLLDDERLLRDAETKVAKAKNEWLLARAREAGVERLLLETKISNMRDIEKRCEFEDEK